jgi:hypothetical protein
MAQQPRRQYNFSDGTLRQFADQLKINVTRDAADFTPRGITATTLTNLQTLINGFDGITTDEELLGRVTTATERKETARETLIKQLRAIRGIADVAYNGKGMYKSFGFEDMTKASDEDLYRMAGRVHRVATEELEELTPHGLTAAMLTDLKAAATDFDEKIDKQVAAMNNRDIAKQERIAAGNNLFTEVSRIVKVGKAIYQDTDAARFNDYILPAATSSGGGEEKPEDPES